MCSIKCNVKFKAECNGSIACGSCAGVGTLVCMPAQMQWHQHCLNISTPCDGHLSRRSGLHCMVLLCRDYLVEYNDTMATLLLSGVTQSLAGLAELTDKFGIAYERSGRRGRGGGGGSMMSVGMYGL